MVAAFLGTLCLTLLLKRSVCFATHNLTLIIFLDLSPSVTGLAVINAHIAAGVFPNGVMPSLAVLNGTHNVIEHDASLTRYKKTSQRKEHKGD
jgi:hypothetical protein